MGGGNGRLPSISHLAFLVGLNACKLIGGKLKILSILLRSFYVVWVTIHNMSADTITIYTKMAVSVDESLLPLVILKERK